MHFINPDESMENSSIKKGKWRKTAICIAIATSFSCIIPSSYAADGEDDEDVFSMSLEDLLDMDVVSATRSESKLSESPVPISVITEKDIIDSGLDSIPEILGMLPEIDVLRVGRGQSEVSIRGKGVNFNRRLLVMIDGRTEYNDLFGVTLWNAFPISVDDILRIEVVRGPASALFGANAYSGVINIITKKPDSDDVKNQIRVHVGENDHRYTSVAINGGNDLAKFRLSAGQSNWDADKRNVVFPGFNRIPTTSNFDTNSTQSLQDITRVSGQGIFNLGENDNLRISSGYSDGEMELLFQPGLPRANWDLTSSNWQLDYTHNWEKNSLQINSYYNDFKYNTQLVPTTAEVNSIPGGANDGRFFFPSIDGDHQFIGEVQTYDVSLQFVGSTLQDKFKYVVGGEYRYIENNGGMVLNENKFINSAFANFVYKFAEDKWQVGMGLRADDDSITGVDYGYTTSLTYFMSETDNIRTTARRAFRAPSLFELFSQVDLNVPNKNQRVNFRGNANVDIESIDSYDITWTKQFTDRLQGSVEVFLENYSDIIGNPDSGVLNDVVLDSGTNTFTTTTSFQNLGNADNKGIQFSIVWLPTDKIKVNAGYRYLKPNDLNAIPGETFFSPENKINLNINWQLTDEWKVVSDIRYTDKTNNSEFTTGNISPTGGNFTRDNQTDYSTVNLSVNYSPSSMKGLRFYVVADNLLDDTHVEYYEFDTVLNAVGEQFGREIWGGVSWSF